MADSGAMAVSRILSSAESYLATYTLSCFQLSQGIFGPTEIRILLVVGTLAALRNPHATLLGHKMLLFDLARNHCDATHLLALRHGDHLTARATPR